MNTLIKSSSEFYQLDFGVYCRFQVISAVSCVGPWSTQMLPVVIRAMKHSMVLFKINVRINHQGKLLKCKFRFSRSQLILEILIFPNLSGDAKAADPWIILRVAKTKGTSHGVWQMWGQIYAQHLLDMWLLYVLGISFGCIASIVSGFCCDITTLCLYKHLLHRPCRMNVGCFSFSPNAGEHEKSINNGTILNAIPRCFLSLVPHT